MKINFKKILFMLSAVLFFELLSFNVFLSLTQSFYSLVLVSALILFLSSIKLEYGILIAFFELIIGSKGYLFFANIFGFTISIRIAIWLIVMLVWFVKYIRSQIYLIRTESVSFKLYFKNKYLYLFSLEKHYRYLFGLFAFILISLFIGLLNNDFSNVFFDFNAWIYFTYIFPLFYVYKINNKEDDKKIENFKIVIISALSWLTFKSLFLLYLFSHNFSDILPAIYRWVRDTGVGEITRMSDDFYRIFFQSHIFVVLAFLFLFSSFVYLYFQKKISRKEISFYIPLLSILLSVSILSFSRTNWLGLLFTLSVYMFFVMYKYGFFYFLKFTFYLFLISIFSFVLLVSVVKFPLPLSSSEFSTSTITERAIQISGEAGVSSRWSLLPELVKEIEKVPIFGAGFGKTLTYKSSDPRVLVDNPSGDYTTYAFEWGWLDIWLKLGFFGLAFYLIFIFSLLTAFYKKSNHGAGNYHPYILMLISISVIHFFSPYLNHPLGIGLVLGLLMLDSKE